MRNETWGTLVSTATDLAQADLQMLRGLAEARRASGLTQAEVAQRLGVGREEIAAFERYDSDPTLSQIRRYRLAIMTPKVSLT